MEDGEAGARADVGADADPDAEPVGRGQIEQARAEEQVAGRAESDAGARLGDARQRPVAHVDAMGKDRAGPDQAEAVVDVEIVRGLRKALRDERDLAGIFGEVGVEQHIRVLGDERSGIGELLGAGGGREARRDRITQAPAAAPAGDQGRGVGAAGGDAVAQALRPEVHQHLAGDDPHVACQRCFEQGVDRACMDGGEDERAGGAVTEQFVEEEGGDVVGMGPVGEGLFRREDMAFQP